MQGDPEWLGQLAVIKLEPGDKLIIKVAEGWAGNIEAVADTLFGLFPENQCIVLAPGIDLGVVRPTAANNPA